MPLPKSNKDLTGVREFVANLHTQFASAATVIGPACATLFDEVAGKLKGVLEGLPKDETAATHAGWALPENWAFEALGAANNLVSGLSLEVGRQKQLASAAVLNIGPNVLSDALKAGTHLLKADHDAALASAVASATANMVPKDKVDQLCSAAKSLGATEGRAALQAELDARLAGDKLATDRTAALTTAGLPLPDTEPNLGLASAAILRAPEAEFAAAKATAETRLKVITEAGLELPAELLSAVWGAEAEYKKFHKTVTSIPALKVRAGLAVAEPFASLPAGGGAASTARMLG
jgi:hypothetical protein